MIRTAFRQEIATHWFELPLAIWSRCIREFRADRDEAKVLVPVLKMFLMVRQHPL